MQNMVVSEVSSVQELLPKGYEYQFPESPIYSSVSDFKAVIRTTIENEDKAEQWRKDFQEICKMTWRLLSGKVAKGKVNVYKRYFRCHHNTMPRSESADKRMASKNTNCPATMIITVKRTQFKKKKSRATDPDPYLPEYPCQIEINSNHNHLIHTADSLRERDVSEETKMKLQELFEKGHSPASALESIKTDLRISEGSNYVFAAADRAICPDIGYCFRLYYKMFSRSYGAPSSEKQQQELQNKFLGRRKRGRQNAATLEAENPATCITEQIMQAASDICQRVENNPSLVPSAKKFVAMTGNLHTDSTLDSALAYFGRYTSRNLKGTKTNLKMLHGATIGVPPTAVAHRVSKLGGRKCIKTSRKPKHSNCPLKEKDLTCLQCWKC